MYGLSDPEKNRRATEAEKRQIAAVIGKAKSETAGNFNKAKGLSAALRHGAQREYDAKRTTKHFTFSNKCAGCVAARAAMPAFRGCAAGRQAGDMRCEIKVWLRRTPALSAPEDVSPSRRVSTLFIYHINALTVRGRYVNMLYNC